MSNILHQFALDEMNPAEGRIDIGVHNLTPKSARVMLETGLQYFNLLDADERNAFNLVAEAAGVKEQVRYQIARKEIVQTTRAAIIFVDRDGEYGLGEYSDHNVQLLPGDMLTFIMPANSADGEGLVACINAESARASGMNMPHFPLTRQKVQQLITNGTITPKGINSISAPLGKMLDWNKLMHAMYEYTECTEDGKEQLNDIQVSFRFSVQADTEIFTSNGKTIILPRGASFETTLNIQRKWHTPDQFGIPTFVEYYPPRTCIIVLYKNGENPQTIENVILAPKSPSETINFRNFNLEFEEGIQSCKLYTNDY